MSRQTSPDAGHRFFIYDAQDSEFYYFATAAERDACSDTVIQAYLDDSWDDSVEQVVAGEVTHAVEQINRQDRPDDSALDENDCDAEGTYWSPEWNHICNYALLPLAAAPEAPSQAALDPVLRQLAIASTRHLALHEYSEALAAQIRALIAGGVDINTARRDRAAWEAALFRRLQELAAPAGAVPA